MLTTKKWGDCKPVERTKAENTPELCFDGLDNDCDGKYDKFDEDCEVFCQPESTRPCYTGDEKTRNRGICKLGIQTCNKDGKGYGACKDEILPQKEECNGKDDNCNGVVDENPDGCKCDKEGATSPCYGGPDDTLNQGICTPGIRTCIKREDSLFWGTCQGDITPQVENCDGIDNDCNGKVDDAKQCNPCGLPGTTQSCFTGKLHQRNQGICRDGFQTCGADGLWSKCEQQVLPEATNTQTGKACDPTQLDGTCEESRCDGQDNDCDGTIDETCPYRACNDDADCQLIDKSKGTFTCQLNRCTPTAQGCSPSCRPDQECKDGSCSCKANTTECNSTCVDTNTNNAHCGKCGQACGANETCQGGSCACKTGWVSCNGSCVDPQSNTDHCGKCDNKCTSTQTCENGQCFGCAGGMVVCGGSCVDTKSDNNHCGGCGNTCTGGKTCQSGTCACPQQAGIQECGGVCVNVNNNIQHCMTCNNACPQGATCNNGACNCSSPQTLCGNACVDIQNNVQHCGKCGTTCSTGEACVNGVCKVTVCPPGRLLCQGVCIDFLANNQHCGACNKACPTGQTCKNGTCLCAPGELFCGSQCINPQNNNNHCGGCGTTCSSGKSCQNGLCLCPKGQSVCGGLCTDLRSNKQHCGVCGNACPAAQSCQNGACVCPTGQRLCSAACRDISKDVNHCGGCDNKCPVGQVCSAGKCACTGGLTSCNNQCVNTNTDNANCGRCGGFCGAGLSCSQNACTKNLCPSHDCAMSCATQGCPAALKCGTDKTCHGWGAVYGSGGTFGVESMTSDSQGNIYIIGFFKGTATIGAKTYTSVGNNDLFVTKISPTGSVLWTTHVGATAVSVYGRAIGVQSFGGDVYITGTIVGNVIRPSFQGATGPVTPIGRWGTYTYFYGVIQNGFFRRVNISGVNIGQSIDVGDIVVDDANRQNSYVYVTGYTKGTTNVPFDAQGAKILTTPTGYQSSAFVVQYDLSGVCQNIYSVHATGTIEHPRMALFQHPQPIPRGKGNQVAITATYSGRIMGTRTTPAKTFMFTSNGSSLDIFVAKFNTFNADLQMLASFGGSGIDHAGDIVEEQSPQGDTGAFLLTGYLHGAVTIGTLPALTTSNAYQQSFVTRLDAGDAFSWAHYLTPQNARSTKGVGIYSHFDGSIHIFGEGYGTFGTHTPSQSNLISNNSFFVSIIRNPQTQTLQYVGVGHPYKVGSLLNNALYPKRLAADWQGLLFLGAIRGEFGIETHESTHTFKGDATKNQPWVLRVPFPQLPQ